MKSFWQTAIGNWRTTALGICIFTATTSATLLHYVSSKKTENALSAILALSGAYAAALGAGMSDPGKQLAIPPGKTSPEVVASHEVPDQPGSVVVKNG